jgi:hypothetical protein
VGIRRLLPVLAGALLASCSLEIAPNTSNIIVTIAVDKGTLLLDESVLITVRAQNVGYDVITLTGPSACLMYVQIRSTETGVLVHDSAADCSGTTVTEEIAPGEERTQTFSWDGLSDGGARAVAGFYSIRGIVRVTGDPRTGNPATIAVE